MQVNSNNIKQKQVTERPFLINFESFGGEPEGHLISTQAKAKIPFPIKRVFWVKDVPAGYVRGNHAHETSEEVVIAIQGEVIITTEMKNGQKKFTLCDSNTGLYIPAKCWVTLTPSANALLLCLVSTDYDKKDYITDYTYFKQIILQ